MRNTLKYPVTAEERLKAVQDAGERWLELGLIGGISGYALQQVETILTRLSPEQQEQLLRDPE